MTLSRSFLAQGFGLIQICEAAMTITLTREEGYYCVVCGKFLPEEDGVIVHDDVPHPVDMDFGDEEKPQ